MSVQSRIGGKANRAPSVLSKDTADTAEIGDSVRVAGEDSMKKIWPLVLVVLVLSTCITLVLTNPSIEAYLDFVERELTKALDRSGKQDQSQERAMLRSIFQRHSHELVVSVLGPNTVRRNWGLASLFETNVFDEHIEILGIGGMFIPLRGLDEAAVRLGRLAF